MHTGQTGMSSVDKTLLVLSMIQMRAPMAVVSMLVSKAATQDQLVQALHSLAMIVGVASSDQACQTTPILLHRQAI